MRQALSRDEIAIGMKEWERIRMENDLSGLKFFWIGDGLSESLVPPGTGADLVWRYESLARALDRRLAGSGPMACAARDAVALAAALGAAFVLTYRTAEDVRAGWAPAICDVFAQCVPCEAVAGDDPFAAVEREHLRHLLVHSGTAGLLWSGLNLAILHLAVPVAATLYVVPPSIVTDDVAEVEAVMPVAESRADPWDGARAFWYQV
jgi:hypothetical protein